MAINEKKPVILRTVLALIVIAVFTYSIYPLQERDFYQTFMSRLKNPADSQGQKLVDKAKAIQTEAAKENKEVFAPQALSEAARIEGVMLSDVADIPEGETNDDAVNSIRKMSSASIRRGIDLAGGVEFTLRLQPQVDANGKMQEFSAEEFNRYRDVAIEVLRKRLENEKIFESEISPAGSDLISLKVPITSQAEKKKLQNLLTTSAKLEFRLVHASNDGIVSAMVKILGLKADEGYPQSITAAQKRQLDMVYDDLKDYEYMTIVEFKRGQKADVKPFFVKIRREMDGKDIKEARPVRDEYNRSKIVFSFNEKGAADFARVTTENKGRQLAVVLDGKLYTAPTIQTEIKAGSGEITGQFSDEEVENIANALQSGNFPFTMVVESVYDVDPTLGADNIAKGIRAGIYGMIAVVIFMIGYYLVAGLIAVFCLAVNVVLVLGALAAFDATLTLPGIAGIVLTIGMAVDANVLIFERIREELNGGKTLATAVDSGFSKALSAVLDANITTLITGVILYYAGTGAIKGFAVTLCIGILTSLFTALFLGRLIFDYLLRMGLKKLPMLIMFKKPQFDFLGKRKIAFAISLVLVIGSFVLMFVKKSDLLAVDLSGGTVAIYDYKIAAPSQKVADVLEKNGFRNARIAYKSSSSNAADQKLEIMVRETSTNKNGETVGAQIMNILNKEFPKLQLKSSQETLVGGLVGAEFAKSGLMALLASIVCMVLYIALRYEFTYAMAAIIALVHDVVVALGIYLLLGQQISLTAIAAVLTIIGYSINDTIVIFDRIREDLRAKNGMTYAQVINNSINSNLNRTLLTSITTALAVLMLLLFGGASIYDFALLMFLGVVIGTYSSVFIASPIVAFWHKKVVGIRETDVNFEDKKLVEE